MQLRAALNDREVDKAVLVIKRLFSNVPYQLHVREEKFYHALLQVACGAAGVKTQSEYSTSHGRIDVVLELPNVLYVVEIKLNESADVALEQIEARRYYEPFIAVDKPIILLGLSFKREPKEFDVTYIMKALQKD